MLIASRKLTLRQGDSTSSVDVRIHQPVSDAKGNWACRFEIDWPAGKRVVDAGGFDAMQALIHALQMIGAEIYTSDYHKAGLLYFDTPGSGYGFPVVPSLRDLLAGEDTKYF